MKFKVSRVSNYHGSSAKPCDSAIKEGDHWIVNIPSLESLIQFIKKNGEIIVNEDDIQIYDGHAE